jgi:two-component sensor histidine kinase
LIRTRRGVWPWVSALLLFAPGLAIALAHLELLKSARFLTFYPAIAAAALIFGWPQGILLLFLSAFAAIFLLFEPYHSFSLIEPDAVVAVIGFVIVGGFIVFLVFALREAINQLEDARVAQKQLFGELQHRVANNLQLVVAMLRNARRGLSDAQASDAIARAEDRIAAMAQLHRRLYDGTAYTDGLEPILREVLAEALQDFPVRISLQIESEYGLSIDQLTAITLLVNEAAMNSAKHAFAQGRDGEFEVKLTSLDDGRLELLMRDNGPGLDPDALQTRGSLGMSIMRAFAAQLGGTLELLKGPGTAWRVAFGAQ